MDGVFFLFSPKLYKANNRFQSPFPPENIDSSKSGTRFLRSNHIQGQPTLCFTGLCVSAALAVSLALVLDSSTSHPMTTNNIADIIKYPPGNNISLHSPPLPWQLQVYNQLAYKNVGLQWNANILYFLTYFIFIGSSFKVWSSDTMQYKLLNLIWKELIHWGVENSKICSL